MLGHKFINSIATFFSRFVSHLQFSIRKTMNCFRDTSSLQMQSEFWQQRGDYFLKKIKAQFFRTILLLSSDHLEKLEVNFCPILRCVILLKYMINFRGCWLVSSYLDWPLIRVREVMGSNLGRTNTQGLKITE